MCCRLHTEDIVKQVTVQYKQDTQTNVFKDNIQIKKNLFCQNKGNCISLRTFYILYFLSQRNFTKIFFFFPGEFELINLHGGQITKKLFQTTFKKQIAQTLFLNIFRQ